MNILSYSPPAFCFLFQQIPTLRIWVDLEWSQILGSISVWQSRLSRIHGCSQGLDSTDTLAHPHQFVLRAHVACQCDTGIGRAKEDFSSIEWPHELFSSSSGVNALGWLFGIKPKRLLSRCFSMFPPICPHISSWLTTVGGTCARSIVIITFTIISICGFVLETDRGLYEMILGCVHASILIPVLIPASKSTSAETLQPLTWFSPVSSWIMNLPDSQLAANRGVQIFGSAWRSCVLVCLVLTVSHSKGLQLVGMGVVSMAVVTMICFDHLWSDLGNPDWPVAMTYYSLPDADIMIY